MLVWSPYHTIVDTKRKFTFFSFTRLQSSIRFSDQTDRCVSLPFTVDEYIAIAKEKHGYNVEQVGLKPPHRDPLLEVVSVWSQQTLEKFVSSGNLIPVDPAKLQGVRSSFECQYNFLLQCVVGTLPMNRRSLLNREIPQSRTMEEIFSLCSRLVPASDLFNQRSR